MYHLHNRPEREIIDEKEINRLLKTGKFATLSLCRHNEPYIVTLSYGYDEDAHSLYFHCAAEGLKMDFISVNPQVCATIIEDGGYISGECGHWYKTLVLWGQMEIVSDPEKKRQGMKILLNHLENDNEIINKKLEAAISLGNKRMALLRLPIDKITAKAGR